MKKSVSLFMALALISGSASAAIHWSEGRPEINEIPLAPSLYGGIFAPLQSQFHNLMPSVPGLELLSVKATWTYTASNQTLSHIFQVRNSNTGVLLRQMPVMNYTAPRSAFIDWTIGFFTIGASAAAKTYSVQSMYSTDSTTGLIGPLNVRVIQHPATGAVIVKHSRTFPVSSADGALVLEWCTVKDITGDGVEDIVITYSKMVGTRRIRTYLIHNVETGVLVRRLVVTI